MKHGWNGWVVTVTRKNGNTDAIWFKERKQAEDKGKSLTQLNAGEVLVFEVL